MKAKNLRIGNYVENYKEVTTIQSVNQWCYVMNAVDEVPVEELKPITITEKWLIDFGFKPNHPIASRELNYFLKEQNITMINHYENGWLFKCDWWKVGKMVHFVHELQNLFFALTGEELELKTEISTCS